MTTCLFLTLSLSIILVIVNSCSKLNNMKKKTEKSQELSFQLDYIFSYIKIIDSKFVGLYIFLISNLLTGLVNLTIQTIYLNALNSFAIITIYMVIIISTSYFVYFYKKSN